VDTVVMDKTGTLTTGKMRVTEIRSAECGVRNHKLKTQNPKLETLLFAASAEQGSEHLLGAAIVDHAKEQEISLLKTEGFKAVPGQGVRAMIAGAPVLVGKRALLEKEDVVIYPELAAEAEALEHGGRTGGICCER